MSRRSPNFPPGLWQHRRDHGRYRSNTEDSNRAYSIPSHRHSFEYSSRGRDPIPWQPSGAAMFARVLDIGSPPEETQTIVRIITRPRVREQEPNPRPADQRDTPTPRAEGNSTLTSEEQNMAMNKLKKKIYDPTPNNVGRRISFYYRDKNRGNYNEGSSRDSDEDGKRCAVCLEDFEPREEVMNTPCNHMFHEDCIVPWVKSNGQCPVCRFTLFERTARRDSSNNGIANVPRVTNIDDDDEALLSIIRAMEEAIMLRDLTEFWRA